MSTHNRRRIRVGGAGILILLMTLLSLLPSVASATVISQSASNTKPPRLLGGRFQPTQSDLATLAGVPTIALAHGDPLGVFEATLEADYPQAYAGIFITSGTTLNVGVVGSGKYIESTAQSLFTKLPLRFRSSGSGSPYTLAFATEKRSLATLYRIRNAITSSASQYSSVYGAGISPDTNTVVVDQTSVPPTANGSATATGPEAAGNATANVDAAISAAYGNAVSFHTTSTPPINKNRTNDSAPWISGDQIVSEGGGIEDGCTLGLPFILTVSLREGNVTAGHCAAANSTNSWYNTNYNSPTFDHADFVGNVDYQVRSPIDEEDLLDLPSTSFWEGGANAYGTQPLTGWYSPPQGATVCESGSFGGTQCGTVSLVNQSLTIEGYNVEDIDFLSGVRLYSGDSGAPAVYPTIYGNLAAGTMIAQDGSSTALFIQVDAILYWWSLVYGQCVKILTSVTQSC